MEKSEFQKQVAGMYDSTTRAIDTKAQIVLFVITISLASVAQVRTIDSTHSAFQIMAYLMFAISVVFSFLVLIPRYTASGTSALLSLGSELDAGRISNYEMEFDTIIAEKHRILRKKNFYLTICLLFAFMYIVLFFTTIAYSNDLVKPYLRFS